MREDIDIIADDEQIEKMNEEYSKLGIMPSKQDTDMSEGQLKNQEDRGDDRSERENKLTCEDADGEKKGVGKQFAKSHIFTMPYPVYMHNECYTFCELCELAGAIINNLDRRFFREYRDYLQYIYTVEDKNEIYVKNLCNMTTDIRAQARTAPLRQALYDLLDIMTTQTLILNKILSYDKSENSKEIRLDHLGATACVHSLVMRLYRG